MTWHTEQLVSFDTETTGVDVEQDRIVTAAILGIDADTWHTGDRNTNRWTAYEHFEWMADPGIEIPAGAAKVHGISTERARTEGWPAEKVIRGISAVLAERVAAGVPLVVMNAPYDLTLLDRELGRYSLPSLAEQAGREPLVIDPRVLDKAADRYRKGSRNLTALCTHYGVTLDGAHNAAADALGAARVAVQIAQQYPTIGRLTAAEVHEAQLAWGPAQALDLAEHFRARGRTADARSVRTEWPLIPRQQDGATR